MRRALAGAAALVLAAAPALAQGLVKESAAELGSFPVTVRFRAFLPAEFDLSAAMPQPGMQGQQPSCTAWAVGYGLRSYYERWRQGWDIADKSHLVSPAYVYDALTGNGGSCNNGTSISDALNLLQNTGARSLADVPYDPDQCRMSSAASAPNQSYRIDTWRKVDVAVLDNVKGEIHGGNPVVIGMDLPDSFLTFKGSGVFDDVSQPGKISHAMLVVGYSERRQAFRLMNSWSTAWGDDGFAWISYRVFSKYVDRAFVARVSGTPPIGEFLASLQAPPALAETVKPIEPAPPPLPPPPAIAPAPQPAPAVTPAPPPPAPRPPVVAVTPPPPPPPVVAVTPPPPRPPIVAVTPPPVRPKPAPKPVEQPPASLAELTKQLSSFDCASLALATGGGRLIGFVASDADRMRLAGAVRQVRAGERPADAVVVRPWPQCEALQTFAPAIAAPHGLALRLNGGRPATLNAGDGIVLDITTPDFPSYLYVTYVQASGDAVHLYRPALLGRALAPRTHVRIGGGGPGQPDMLVSAPFGHEMVVAVAAASPLFTADRPDQEFERDFLTAYRAAYIAKSAGGLAGRLVSAAVLPLQTVDTAK